MSTPRDDAEAPGLQAQSSPTRLLRALLERRHLDSSNLELAAGEKSGQSLAMRLRLQKAENFVAHPAEDIRKLATNYVSSIGADRNRTLVYWLKSDGTGLEIYYGVFNESRSTLQSGADESLIRTLKANFPGVEAGTVHIAQRQRMLDELEAGAAATMTGIPGFRDNAEMRLDEALEGVFQVPFDILLFARPVSAARIDKFETKLSLLINHLHTLSQRNVSANVGETFSESLNESFQRTWSEQASVTETQSTSSSESKSRQSPTLEGGAATFVGGVLGAGAGFLATGNPAGAVGGAKIGGSIGSAFGPTKTSSQTNTFQEGRSTTHSSSVSQGQTVSAGSSHGKSVSRQLSLEKISREAMSIREVLETHLERIKQGRSLGMWETSVHVMTGNKTDLRAVTDVLSGALRGDNTYLEPLRSIEYSEDVRARVCEDIIAGRDPEVDMPEHPIIPGGEQLATLLSSDEVGLWLRPPTRDLPGLPVRKPVRFSSNMPEPSEDDPSIKLGALQVWNRPIDTTPVSLRTRDLCSHVFVSGTTGAGKTTTVQTLLTRLQQLSEPVPFMLLEPAKDEYGELFERLETMGKDPVRLSIDGNDERLRISPFRPPTGLPLGRHVDAVRIMLRSCFAMQESLPQLLERILVNAYRECGWDDFTEVVSADDSRRFPTFADLLPHSIDQRVAPKPKNNFEKWQKRDVEPVVRALNELGYSDRVSNNLKAAMRVRLESFTHGFKGEIFNASEETDFSSLLDRPVFVSLSDIQDPDIRRFLLGAVFLRIYGTRAAESRRGKAGDEDGLRHVTVLEEAHHFLRASSGTCVPGAELVAESNRLVADALAELRAYGEGIIIADQSPAELDRSVVRNTNTKLVHRLLADEDCQMVGDSIGLEADKQVMLRRLAPGECLVQTPSMLTPVACKVERIN